MDQRKRQVTVGGGGGRHSGFSLNRRMSLSTFQPALRFSARGDGTCSDRVQSTWIFKVRVNRHTQTGHERLITVHETEHCFDLARCFVTVVSGECFCSFVCLSCFHGFCFPCCLSVLFSWYLFSLLSVCLVFVVSVFPVRPLIRERFRNAQQQRK